MKHLVSSNQSPFLGKIYCHLYENGEYVDHCRFIWDRMLHKNDYIKILCKTWIVTNIEVLSKWQFDMVEKSLLRLDVNEDTV